MNLKTTYLGIEFNNPIVPSASPLSRDLDGIKRMAEAGAGAIVMHSLFEEQIQREAEQLHHFLEHGNESFAEALSFFPEVGDFRVGPEDYLERLQQASQQTGLPIIGSLNGVSTGGWIDYARKMQEAGAAAIELNVYWIPTDPKLSAADVEQVYLDVLAAVKKAVTIPVAVKLSPYFSALANMAVKLQDAGADGLVLFNRFYQPDIDLDALSVATDLTLSTSASIRLPLRWIAVLREHFGGSLAATSGVHSAADALKLSLVGADVVMICAALLKNGVGSITEIRDGMAQWLEQHEYESLSQARGSMSQAKCVEPAAYERAQYIHAIEGYEI